MKIQKNKLISIDSDDIKDGVLYLPESVEKIADGAIQYPEEQLVKVVAPGLLSIGNDNFHECEELTHFEAPLLKSIGDLNFMTCNELISFEAPLLTSIGFDNFNECNELLRFVAPVLTDFAGNNFRYCNALIEFEAPILTSIGDENFNGCDALTRFEAPLLTYIGDENFNDCNMLTDFEIPKLTSIGSGNFRYCDALLRFEAPKVTSVGKDNFQKCDVLTSVRFGAHQYTVKSANGMLTIIEKSESSDGLLIHTGFIFNNCKGGVPNLSETVLIEKEDLSAHGETVEKAIYRFVSYILPYCIFFIRYKIGQNTLNKGKQLLFNWLFLKIINNNPKKVYNEKA